MSESYDERFQNAATKLLNKSILCMDFSEDRSDYKFIKDNLKDFSDFFARIGMRIEIRNVERTLRIIETDHSCLKFRREPVTRVEAAMFIILRTYYLEKMEDLEYLVPIKRREILDAMPSCFDGRTFLQTKYKDALLKFRRHDLISWEPGSDLTNPECKIIIYPSILFAQDDSDVQAFFEDLKAQMEELEKEDSVVEEEEEE